MEYNVDYFIKKFTNTRDDKWIVNDFQDGNGGSCANGWCGIYGKNINGELFHDVTQESVALCKVFGVLKNEFVFDTINYYSSIAAIINNGDDKRYQQPTPKQRILAALYDIKNMQDGQAAEEKPQPKIKTVYVTISETLKEQAKELISQS